MRYYILPDDFGVAITNGDYVEIHIPEQEEGFRIPDADTVHAGLIEFIDQYAEDNTLGDAVFDEIVSDDAPIFDGTIIPNVIFYKLPERFPRPDGWEQILPTRFNTSNYVDTLTEDEIMLAEIDRILGEEYDKPIEEWDNDLISECWDEIEAITNIKTKLSAEEIATFVDAIIRRAKEEQDEGNIL